MIPRLLLALSLTGCAAFATAAPVACKVVSALNSACVLLTFVGTDGKPHTVKCSPAEVAEWGRDIEERHASQAP